MFFHGGCCALFINTDLVIVQSRGFISGSVMLCEECNSMHLGLVSSPRQQITSRKRSFYLRFAESGVLCILQGLKSVLLKTAADQLIWAPIMTCVFFAVLKSLEGHPELIWPTIQVSCLTLALDRWPPSSDSSSQLIRQQLCPSAWLLPPIRSYDPHAPK